MLRWIQHVQQTEERWPRLRLFLVPMSMLLLALAITCVLVFLRPDATEPEPSEDSPSPSPSQSEQSASAPTLLVTAAQMARLSYRDSTMGTLSWSLDEKGLLELNRVLIQYGIVDADEICHFLAQATVETGAGLALLEQGDENYLRAKGINEGTRGAGYLHLTYEYGQMAFAVWMMKRHIPALSDITFLNPANNDAEHLRESYFRALRTAANRGVNVSLYSKIVYDPESPDNTGAQYIATNFAWESAAYYWHIAGVSEALAATSGAMARVDAVSSLIGGKNHQSRREAYTAFAPVLVGELVQ